MGEPSIYLFHKNEPLTLSTGAVHRVRLVVPKLETQLPLRQLEGVAETFEPASFVVWMRALFGADVPEQAYRQLQADLRAGAVRMPDVRLSPQIPLGHLAAYDSERSAILVSHALIERAVSPDDENGRWLLVAALLEEFGHHVDHLLRTQYSSAGGDAPDDEGAKFAYALLNLDWGSRAASEVARLVYPFGSKPIDADWQAYHAEVSTLVGPDRQTDLDIWRQYEFFSAGRGKENRLNHGHSYGHQSIENALEDAKFTKDERLQIYFGNWLRDYSQAVDEHTLKVFTRKWIVGMLDLRARAEFKDTKVFEVTVENLGAYLTEDHLDNPFGMTDKTGTSPDLNKGFLPEQCAIDPDNWMQKHLRGSVAGRTSGFQRIQERLKDCVGASGSLRLQHLGAALHALEDYFSHSNFLEVALRQLGYPVYPWTAPFPPRGGTVYPIVTGCFGGDDTAASLLLEIGENMQKLFECERGKKTIGTEMARLALYDWQPTWGARYDALMKLKKKLDVEWLDKLLCESVDSLAAMMSFTIGGVVRLLGNQIDEAQTLFLSDPDSYNPTHTQLAKDHDDHPLHVLAAKCAETAVRHVGRVMQDVFAGSATLDDAVAAFALFMCHPAKIPADSPAQVTLQLVAAWAKQNAGAVARLGSQGWIEHASKSEEWKELNERALRLTAAWDEAAAEAARAQQVGLESYARKRALDFGDYLQRQLTALESAGASALDEYRILAQDSLRQLDRHNVERAIAQVQQLTEQKSREIQEHAVASFRQYALLAERKYAEITSVQVQARYREQARVEADTISQSLRSWADDQVTSLQKQTAELEQSWSTYSAGQPPTQVLADKLARIRSIFDAKSREAIDRSKQVARDLQQMKNEIADELANPPPKTELQKLTENEAQELERKLRAAASASLSALQDPVTQVELEAFIQKQVARLQALLRQSVDQAQSTPQREKASASAQTQLGRLNDGLQKPLAQLSEAAPELGEQLKNGVDPLADTPPEDLQLQYVSQLKPHTRGIEPTRRK